MAYPYPPHHPNLPYTGNSHYFLTFRTERSSEVFTSAEVVTLVLQQFLQAAAQRRFEITANCFMPDHVHVLVHGLDEASDCNVFIKLAKQYSALSLQTTTHETALANDMASRG
jgi:REP element-mobilizing transposase RayT